VETMILFVVLAIVPQDDRKIEHKAENEKLKEWNEKQLLEVMISRQM
jgi:hypothetical protein